MPSKAKELVKGGVQNVSGSFSSRSKLSFSEEPVITKGWLYRGTSVQGLVNKRYAAIYPTQIATYHKEDDPVPTKKWDLEEGCLVSEVEANSYMIRDKGVSTLWAVARHHYTRQQLFGFVIKFPAGNPHHKYPFLICFESETSAKEWQVSIASAIKQFSADLQSRPTADVLKQFADAVKNDEDYEPIPALPSEAPGKEFGDTRRTKDVENDASKPSFEESIKETWSTVPTLEGEAGDKSSVEHVNGIAVYQEGPAADGSQGAFMVSAVVSASPRDVFAKLVALGNEQRPMPFAGDLLEVVDERTRIIRHALHPGRLAGAVCAPREIVMQQTWREVEDGTITVLGHSVDHAAVHTGAGWSWFSPIRTRVESAGFTLAPLQSRYRWSAESQSCLVTFVLKLDLGGTLSDTSLLSTLLFPWAKALARSFVDPLLMSVIALRDQVEQSQYVTQAFMPSPEEAAAEGEVPSVSARTASSELKSIPTLARLSSRKISSETDSAVSPSKEAAKLEDVPEKRDEEEEASFNDSLTESASHALLDQKYWSCPGNAGFVVRGLHYLQDSKKIPADDPVFSLASVDLVKCNGRASHLARFLPSMRHSKAPFNFIMNLMLPGSQNMAMVVTWAAEQTPLYQEGSLNATKESTGDSDSEMGISPFDTVLARFLAGDDAKSDERRHSMFKLIPSIVKGSWMARQSVGHTPVLLGRKLKTYYHRGSNYFEVDVDVTSSRAANSITGMVIGATTSMIIDMGIVLEGHSEDELPECLLGTVRIDHLDMKAFTVLDNSEAGLQESSSKKTA